MASKVGREAGDGHRARALDGGLEEVAVDGLVLGEVLQDRALGGDGERGLEGRVADDGGVEGGFELLQRVRVVQHADVAREVEDHVVSLHGVARVAGLERGGEGEGAEAEARSLEEVAAARLHGVRGDGRDRGIVGGMHEIGEGVEAGAAVRRMPGKEGHNRLLRPVVLLPGLSEFVLHHVLAPCSGRDHLFPVPRSDPLSGTYAPSPPPARQRPLARAPHAHPRRLHRDGVATQERRSSHGDALARGIAGLWRGARLPSPEAFRTGGGPARGVAGWCGPSTCSRPAGTRLPWAARAGCSPGRCRSGRRGRSR